jgi:mitochondrial enoyl-[acyl-carrier protein] reductase / trans-2-enoyl-CoA reductase
MKQIIVERFGQPSAVAKCVDGPNVDDPSPWEVIVDIEAFPINAADLAMMIGRYGILPKPPSPIGMEAVGRISAIGKSVTKLNVGQKVVMLANNNWSQQRKVPEALVHPIPDNADSMQFSMLKVNPATALILLSEFAQLTRGDWVLQNAPLSSVGQCVQQIARLRGLRTINIVRRPEARAEVLELGGDVAIVSGPNMLEQIRAHIGHEPVMLGLDAVAGQSVQHIAECLAEGSQIINYGMLSGEPCQLAAEQTVFRGITLRGFWLSKMLNRLSYAQRTNLYTELSDMLCQKSLEMRVDSCFHISDIDAALRRAEANGRNGKVVVLAR